MQFLILSDIHANLQAFEAVLAAAPPELYDRVLVLGDLVGYGANPNEIVDRVYALNPDALIRGNHDKVASGLENTEGFNRLAARAAQWTFDALTPTNRQRVADLQAGPVIVDDRIEICHGTPFDEDVYVFEHEDALQALDAARRPICLFGHTHVPVVFELADERLWVTLPQVEAETTKVSIKPNRKYLINPGSIGQPRDGDPRAAYATFDADRNELELRRVTYPVDVAQARIRESGLPEHLAHRLALGR